MRVSVAIDPADSCALGGADRYDLRTHPQAIEHIEPARRYPALRNFLALVNSGESLFLTFGCKAWSAMEDGAAEAHVFASRVDILFAHRADNFVRTPLEDVANWIAELLEQESAGLWADLRIVPAKFTAEQDGYCLRLSLFARGSTSGQAEMRWALGLAHAQQAILFVARALRQST